MCTIADNNKLIAEFIGYPSKSIDSIEATLIENSYHWYSGRKKFYYISGDYHAEDYLLFHLDWNWLMQAVDKIEEIEDEEGFSQYVFEILMTSVNIIDNRYALPVVETFERTKIEATYKAVIEFINFYNRQQHEN